MSSFVYRDGMWETIREHVPFPDVVVLGLVWLVATICVFVWPGDD